MTRRAAPPARRDWDAPLLIDPVVEQWGSRGQQAKPTAPRDNGSTRGYDQDYENLGHTFLHGRGNRYPVAQVISVEEHHPEPAVQWHRLVFYVPAGLFTATLATLTAAGMVPAYVLIVAAAGLAALGVMMIQRHSIRYMRPEHARDFKRGRASTPAAARAHAAATLYKQRQYQWRQAPRRQRR